MSLKKTNRILRCSTTAIAMAAVCASQAQTSPPIDITQGNTLFVVPYAHLDTQWRWAYPQTIREYLANTLTRNFSLIENNPHYIFNFSGSRRYEMMKEYYPADYQKMKAYIQAGRWFPCGSSVDEGDANVPSGESIVRHVLYGNHYFRKEFGVASQEFMLPDCFGFPYALPSLLAHCGVKGFSTQKLTWGSAVGIPFKVGVWEGPDGRSVVAALDPGAYSGDVAEDLSQNTSWLARIQNTGRLSGAYVDYHYYGTGDTGGAPRPRSVQWIEKSIAGTGPVKVVSSKADAMFNALKPEQIAKLPRYKGELLLTQHSAGSISSEAYMKRWNRKTELLADAAEKSSIAAMLFGGVAYPADRLYKGWDLVLGSQMHDMLPGTSIPKAYEYCWNDFLLAQNIFANTESDAVGVVAKQMNTKTKGTPLVVFNPLSIARNDVVEATINNFPSKGSVVVSGPDGIAVPTQVLTRTADSVKVAFSAQVGPTGFTVFSVQSVPSAKHQSTDLKIDSRHLENQNFKVTVNDAGDISSIIDKRSHHEVLKSPSRYEMQYENPGQYPAWNMDWADAKLPPRDIVTGPAKFRIVENGPTRVTLEVERKAKGSKFVQDIRLTPNSTKIEVVNNIDWATRERALKISFPLTSGNPEATYDLQLGTTKRGNNDPKKYEVPQHQWFDLTKSDASYGAGILNDSKFASDKPNDNTVRLTLIYTPGVRGGTEDQATQDFGRHQITYAIAPHSGDWREGQIPWQAKRLNQPLRAFVTTPHSGPLGKTFSLVSTSSKDVEVQALKKAEDSNEIVVRLREINGTGAKGVHVTFPRAVIAAREVNGQEQPLGSATVANGKLVANVPAYSLKTYALTLVSPLSSASLMASKQVSLPYNADVVSTDANPGDGMFANSRSLPAEQLPSTLTVDEIKFGFGSKANGAKNAVVAKGQTIKIPAGFSKVYLVAAADEDTTGTFHVGNKSATLAIQAWRGYVGSWDNRLWSVDPGPDFNNYGDTMNGLKPGYVKKSEVAWYASHNHSAKGNSFYDYSYLYKYGIEIPDGATQVVLPNNPRIKVLAMSVAKSGHDDLVAAQPLSDTLAGHKPDGVPTVTPASGHFKDATYVRIDPPLYFHAGSIHFTTDGSTPTAKSPTYKSPILLSNPTILKVVQEDTEGKLGAVTSTRLDIEDTTAPSVTSALVAPELSIAKVTFSEPVSKSTAEDTAHYDFGSDVKVSSAKLGSDHRSVDLVLEATDGLAKVNSLTVTGVQDLAKVPNASKATAHVEVKSAIFTSPVLEPKTSRVFNSISGMPVHATDPWTLNLFCKIDDQPEDRTMIAGFGRSIDGRTGTGRYFTKFARGINFWIANRDIATNTPIDLGKWQMLTATYDGTTLRLYKNGEKFAEEQVQLENDSAQVRVMPLDAWERKRRFGGEVRDLTVWDLNLTPSAIKRLWESKQNP